MIEELLRSDSDAAAMRQTLIADVEELVWVAEVDALADELKRAMNIPQTKAADALHLAYAIQYNADCFLTWNCAHFANLSSERAFFDFCRERVLWMPLICTPEELISSREEGS